jgi:splicing factor 3B subunit 2
MGLTTAERNRNKRERKKRERDKRKKQEEVEKDEKEADKEEIAEDVEVEYVEDTVGAAAANPMPDGVPQQVDEEGIESVLQRFQQRAAVTVVTDDEKAPGASASQDDGDSVDGDDADNKNALSNRKMRELLRPSVADLKRRVKRPDLVEAHDVTSADPDFLIYLKSVPNTVPVPRHWGRKRKYLQGKRGFEKPPFQLPDFIVKTGITALRDTVAADESKMSVKQKNRSRVAPKMGAMDVDYRTLYEAFFKHQSKPKSLTGFGDLYYEGKELETRTAIKPGGPLSKALRDALGMASESSPPPWLMNMVRKQRMSTKPFNFSNLTCLCSTQCSKGMVHPPVILD